MRQEADDRMTDIDPRYVQHLVDPVDKSKCSWTGQHLLSQSGRKYPVVDGVPVMLVPEIEQTMGIAAASVKRAHGDKSIIDTRAPQLYLETLGISEDEKRTLIGLLAAGSNQIDPVVLLIIGATSGYAYKHLIGNAALAKYPIPTISLPKSDGGHLLDLGCNWGRWSMAAERAGYNVVGLDPSLGAVMAARRVANQLALNIKYVVGDGRLLPFAADTFDTVYSYSVIQHFSKADAQKTLDEVRRTLKRGGAAKIQMANKLGIRGLQHQARRRFREPGGFDVRYYTVPVLSGSMRVILQDSAAT
jgi:SAM-dependent methyltransferase/uncharacterized protein YbaR (Trm112 family)